MKKINLAVFASGGGTNFINLYKRFINDDKICVKLLISNNSKSGAIRFAKENNILNRHISSIVSENPDQEILDTLINNEIDIIALAGYMKKLSGLFLDRYDGKILNLHPSLLPKYGGKGMYGKNVHEAVIKAGETESGATVHLVNEEYDRGEILIQKSVSIGEEETAETLQKKVAEVEYEIYPEAIREFVERGAINSRD